MTLTEGQISDLSLALQGYSIGENTVVGLKNYPNIGVSLRWKVDRIIGIIESRALKTLDACNELRNQAAPPDDKNHLEKNTKIGEEINSIRNEVCELEIPTLPLSSLVDRDGKELEINSIFDILKVIITE